MINKEVFKQLIIENQNYINKVKVKYRNYSIEKNANYIFIGSRRAGKSYFMYEVAQNLLRTKITKEHILFVNFEDERLIEFKTQHFNLLLEAYRELFDLKPIIFLDEVQNIKAWEKFVRRLADKNFKVFVTGSNAKMLSQEMASVLGGRFMIKEIHPLSFKEFLSFKKISLDKNYEFTEQKTLVKRLLNTYFNYGGFPEILNFTKKREYLSSLYQKVLYGDVIARHEIKNKYAMRLLVKKMAESVNNEISFNRIKNLIVATGTSIGTNTAIEYFEYLKAGFLLFDLQNYATKFSERETKKKFYFSDVGILSLFLSGDKSKLLENLVYSELRQRYSDNFYFHKRKYETDFYVPENKMLIQASYSLQDYKTKEREIKSLQATMSELDINSGSIITYDDAQETIKNKGRNIHVIPLWKWLLS